MHKIKSNFKKLYVKFQRIEFELYLNSKEFEYHLLEIDFDEEWEDIWNVSKSKLLDYSDNLSIAKEKLKAFMFLLTKLYGDGFSGYSNFSNFLFPTLLNYVKWSKYKIDIKQITNVLKEDTIELNKVKILEFLKEARVILNLKPTLKKESVTTSTLKKIVLDKSKVFIVHGHDDSAKFEVANYISSLNLEPIILHQQASSGQTIIEKIEANSNVGFGIVIYTPDDFGGKQEKEKIELPRARQNVVFEHGFLMGKIGRSNVCALIKGNLEKPNDISGVVYVNMDNHNGWQISIAKELKKSGYDIDMNSLLN